MEFTVGTKQSDIKAFKALFEEFYTVMVRTAVYYVSDVAVAEDLVQEIFTRLWEKKELLNKVDHVKGYLQNAVKNKCMNHIQHLQVVDSYQKHCLLQEVTEREESSPEEVISKVQYLLNQLPEKRRIILELSIIDSKSYQEIATSLDISVNTVKDHIKKAYAFLRKAYGEQVTNCILFIAFVKNR